uniref:GH18 domain-containing protein n=1 Tax=viral metagenome TaxID=1070528 RepID=A0A6C0E0J9_9ZZZZ
MRMNVKNKAHESLQKLSLNINNKLYFLSKNIHIFLDKMFLLLLLNIVSANVILSSGLTNWTNQQLTFQYNLYKTYKSMNIITGSSILVYEINENGEMDTYKTNNNVSAEEYQYRLKKELGLKSYPCFFCDTTIQMCGGQGFSERFEKLYKNMSGFIDNTITKAIKYDYDGYYLDIELSTVIDKNKLTHFVNTWSKALKQINRTLNIWIDGYLSSYNSTMIYDNNDILLTTMNTYDTTFDIFLSQVALNIGKIDNNRLSFGFLTYDSVMNSVEIDKIIQWCKIFKPYSLSLWASTIPLSWYQSIRNYF